MKTFLLALSLMLVLLAPAAEAAAKPKLRVKGVQASGYAHPGGALPLRVTVAGKRRAKVRAYLSSDRRRSKGDVALRGSARPLRGRAELAAVLPDGTAAGAYYVLGCAGKACKPAKRRVTVTAAADPSKTSAALIEADRAAGRLSDEKALTYRVFAIFGDPGLPARYTGDVTAEEDDGAMRQAADAWPGLSKRTRARIAQYFAPPPLQQRAAASVDEEDPCVADEDLKPHGWKNVPAAGGKVRIHWRPDDPDAPDSGKHVREVVGYVNAAYPHFKKVMGREPLSDAKVDCWHGPDGALDIYLSRVYWMAAITVPSAKTKYTTPDCDGMPSYIVSNTWSRSFSLRFTIAHELFHAFQNAFPYSDGCKDYAWFDEASANWAAHAAFPDDDSEHFFEDLLESPGRRLQWRDYEAWPFVLWMEKTFGEGSVRTAYEAFGRKTSLPALDEAIGGFRRNYLDFAKHGWNQDPVPSFRGWDRFTPSPLGSDYSPLQTQNLFLAGQRARTAYVPTSNPELGREYNPFAITDDEIQEIVFRNPLAGDPDARVGAIITLRSGATRFEEWSGKERVTFCREQPEQDIGALVIVYANSSLEKDDYITGTPELGLRDTCRDERPWQFKVLSATLETHTEAEMPGSSMQLCGMVAGLPISGTNHFKASTSEPWLSDENTLGEGLGGRLEGAVSVAAPARWLMNLKGCEGITNGAGEVTPCETSVERTPTPDGRWDIGFSFEAASKNAGTATLTWWVGDPSVGFFDATDPQCNVSEIRQDLTLEEMRQEVPMDRFTAFEPVTLRFQGNDGWSQDPLGRPATISYDWTYELTIQRVGAP